MQAAHGRHCSALHGSDHFHRSPDVPLGSRCTPTITRRPLRRGMTRCQAAQQSKTEVQQTKQKLASLAGKKYGHNLSTQQKQEVDKIVKQLEGMAPHSKQPELTGSNWKLLYTTSGGSSGGKVGPLVGLVDQVFHNHIFIFWV